MIFNIEISEKNEKGFWQEPRLSLKGFQTLDSAKLEMNRLAEKFTQANVGPRRIDIKAGNRIQATMQVGCQKEAAILRELLDSLSCV